MYASPMLRTVLTAIRGIVLQHPNETVAVVSHKPTIRLVLASLLGIEPRGYRGRLDQAPARLDILDFKDAVRARLTASSATSHYAEHPRRPSGRPSKWWDPD